MDKSQLAILALVVMSAVAFVLYSIPSQTFPNINEFDPFYHARVVRELVTTGSIPEWDMSSYWPEGMPMWSLYPHLWHYVLAGAYYIAAFATHTYSYDQQLLVTAMSWVMPFVGVFSLVSMFLLGREIRGKKAGLIAAGLFAFASDVMYKSMFAEIEEDAFGVGLLVFSLFAYVYALKRGGWKNGLFAGLALSALVIAWRGAMYAAFLVAALAVVMCAKAIVSKDYKALDRMTETFAVSLPPIAIIGLLFGSLPMSVVYALSTMGGALALMVAANYWLNYRVVVSNKAKAYKFGVAALAIGIVIAAAVFGPFVMNQTLAGLDTGDKPIRLSYTIAENKSMEFEGILADLGWLALFGLAAMAYLPVRCLLKWKDPSDYDVLALLFVATATIMFFGAAKMQYFFTPAIMLCIGILLADLIGFAKRFGDVVQKAVAIAIILLLLFHAYTAFNQMAVIKDNYPVQPGWFKAMEWLKTTPEDTALLTWWDYGHWIAFLGDRRAIVDNSNINYTKVGLVANIFTEYRANSSEALEERVLPQLKAFDVDYVGIDRILLYSKWGALTYIAERQCLPTKTLAIYNLSFPALTEASKQSCGYGMTYSGEIGMAPCPKKIVSSEAGNETFYECSFIQGANVQFTEAEWAEIKAARWPGYELTLGDATNGLRARVYGQPDDTIMFFHAGGKILYDAPVNYMYGFRLFFKDPGLKHHELVQNEWLPNEEVVVQKVVY